MPSAIPSDSMALETYKSVQSDTPRPEIGTLCQLIGKTSADPQNSWAYDVWKNTGDGAGGHLNVVYDKVIGIGGKSWRVVSTITSTHIVEGLSKINFVPIYPNDNSEFPMGDTHGIRYRFVNTTAKTFSNEKSYLRRDNAFVIPEVVLRPVLGDDGKAVMLDEQSFSDWSEYMVKNDIVMNSSKNPRWLVEKGLMELKMKADLEALAQNKAAQRKATQKKAADDKKAADKKAAQEKTAQLKAAQLKAAKLKKEELRAAEEKVAQKKETEATVEQHKSEGTSSGKKKKPPYTPPNKKGKGFKHRA